MTVLSVTQDVICNILYNIQDESDSSFFLSGLIFPIMAVVLYIISLITRLLANKKKKLDTVSFYNLFVNVHGVFQQRNRAHQTGAVSLLPLRCFPLFFFS